MAKHECECCGHLESQPCAQTMDEMEFERGIWPAALDGELSRVKSFLDRGVNFDMTDKSGYTALHYACSNGHLEVCKMLLDRGACCNKQTKAGQDTPLHRAAYRGYEDIVQLLLEKGGDPSICNADGQNALHKAAERCHRGIMDLLIAQNPAILHHKDIRNRTALDMYKDMTGVNLTKIS
ncbi:ankyrin repeat domain-containing protein 39-like [Nematostella vectensis]|uniref:ankyrin repeat domain-containing protein 39-like n=1 Tax=Nematostella vectensis TaxID=45351 RepID=UPI00138FCA80|nr:ankyrin repeat domain-containing protein 39-like [Nematostella vectensis]